MYELKSVTDTSQNCGLEEEKAKSILESIASLGTHMHAYLFYQIVKRNLNQLLEFIYEAQNTIQKIDILECNRLLFNFADTFYGYINFFESNYKETFESIKNDLFDNYFEYAFIYKLRNYIIHEDLPIFKLSREVGEGYIKSKFIISKEKLLLSTRIGSAIKNRISNKFQNTEDIDILPVLLVLQKLIVEIQIKVLAALFDRLLSAFKNLRGYVLDNEEIYLLKDGEIVNGLLNVLNKYYKCMADNFVYSEGLLADKTINKIYMDFSYVYFGQKDVIYKPQKQND